MKPAGKPEQASLDHSSNVVPCACSDDMLVPGFLCIKVLQ